MTVRSTRRWRGITALGFVGLAAGALAQAPGLLVAGMVSVGFAAYARGGAAPAVDLAVERTVSDATPAPGDRVTVETTVRNDGEGTLPDLRLVDGVPEGLDVADGVARTYTALRPGESATFAYQLAASRGEHRFGPATVFARDASGAVEREVRVAGDPTTVTCVPRLTDAGSVPLDPTTTSQAGTVNSAVPGPGVEFHSVRDYRPGDPLSRVDWNRFAETGELATVEFDAERMAAVVLVVDARRRAYAATETDQPHAVEHCVAAARQVAASVLSGGNQVGAASLGPEGSYLDPGLGRAHRVRLREFLAAEVPPSPTEADFYPRHLDRLRRQLREDAQVVWVTPAVDDYAVSVARTFRTDGHAVTVVSPDVTVAGSAGERLARAERSLRLAEMREAGVRVVDWHPTKPLAAAVRAAERGWSG